MEFAVLGHSVRPKWNSALNHGVGYSITLQPPPSCSLGRRNGSLSPSAEDRLPKLLHFAEFDVIIGVVRARSVHEVGYGHKWDWKA